MGLLRRIAYISCLMMSSNASGQEEANGKPHLVLNAGGHTDIVRSALFTRDGKEVITVSTDRTLRIWDAATGASLRTLRPPVGDGRWGAISVAALSPDGKTVAIAVLRESAGKFPIYFINLADGEIQRILPGHEGIVYALAFNPQGDRLASAGNDATVKIWDAKKGDIERILIGHKSRVTDLAFSPDGGQIASSSEDATSRIWDLQNGQTRHVLEGQKSKVSSISWSSDGKRLATGGIASILLWSDDGKLVHAFDHLKGNVLCLKFMAQNRELLFATSSTGIPDGLNRCGCLDLYRTGEVRSEFWHSNSVFCADVSPDGHWIVSSGGDDSETFVWRATDAKKISLLASKGKTTWVAAWGSADAHIGWGTSSVTDKEGKRILERSFDIESLEWGDVPDQSFHGSRLTRGDASLTVEGPQTVQYRRGKNQKVTFQGLFYGNDRFQCGELLPERYAAIGSVSGLYLIDVNSGKVVRSFVGHTSIVLSVACSPNGRYLISTSADQTLRIWGVESVTSVVFGGIGIRFEKKDERIVIKEVINGPASGILLPGDQIVEVASKDTFVKVNTTLETAKYLRGEVGSKAKLRILRPGDPQMKELVIERRSISNEKPRGDPIVSFFFAGDDWIAWTPEGYFAASPGGEQLMGWQVNNGLDKLASFYPASQFRKTLYRPDVIKLLLKAGSVEKALELADAERGKQSERVEIAMVLPPKVRLTTPERALGVKTATLEVRARADSTGAHPVTALHLMIDGRPLPQGRVRIDNPKLGEATATWNILLTAGTQRLSVKADSAVSSALSDEVVVTYQPPDPVETIKLPSLYVLAVGISDYPKDLKLNYAHKDAQVLAETLRTHSKALYEKVEVKELLNAQATQREIRIGLDWLSTRMTQRDVAVLYLAGHGEIAANSNFYFLPADVDPDKISATGVPGNEIKDALTAMPGKVIFMLDACHAGGFESTKKRNARALTDDLIRDLVADERGVIALCASTGRQFALESNEHRHGIFTLAIVEGLKGKATRVEGAIYLHHLDAYVTDRVKELSQGRQSPTTARPANVRSFPLTRP